MLAALEPSATMMASMMALLPPGEEADSPRHTTARPPHRSGTPPQGRPTAAAHCHKVTVKGKWTQSPAHTSYIGKFSLVGLRDKT